jgi:hypothetical protein
VNVAGQQIVGDVHAHQHATGPAPLSGSPPARMPREGPFSPILTRLRTFLAFRLPPALSACRESSPERPRQTAAKGGRRSGERRQRMANGGEDPRRETADGGEGRQRNLTEHNGTPRDVPPTLPQLTPGATFSLAEAAERSGIRSGPCATGQRWEARDSGAPARSTRRPSNRGRGGNPAAD